tara:strand:- start:500 stop:817 length:318 start_codon:yes stop_codon:yes gene_type:complete
MILKIILNILTTTATTFQVLVYNYGHQKLLLNWKKNPRRGWSKEGRHARQLHVFCVIEPQFHELVRDEVSNRQELLDERALAFDHLEAQAQIEFHAVPASAFQCA